MKRYKIHFIQDSTSVHLSGYYEIQGLRILSSVPVTLERPLDTAGICQAGQYRDAMLVLNTAKCISKLSATISNYS